MYDDFQISYEYLLEKSKLPSLKTRRMRTIALETFKIINKKSPLSVANISGVRQHWLDTACTACTFLSSTPAIYVLFELVK
jgi:hypothetical protein